MSRPLLGIGGPLIGFAALLLGAFSRFGLWRQVLGAVVLLVLVQLVDNVASGVALRDERAWPLAYLAPLLGIALGVALVWWAGRPRRIPRPEAAPVLPEAPA
jgi:lipopolysaccharide export system permease protein